MQHWISSKTSLSEVPFLHSEHVLTTFYSAISCSPHEKNSRLQYRKAFSIDSIPNKQNSATCPLSTTTNLPTSLLLHLSICPIWKPQIKALIFLLYNFISKHLQGSLATLETHLLRELIFSLDFFRAADQCIAEVKKSSEHASFWFIHLTKAIQSCHHDFSSQALQSTSSVTDYAIIL